MTLTVGSPDFKNLDSVAIAVYDPCSISEELVHLPDSLDRFQLNLLSQYQASFSIPRGIEG